MPDPTSNTSKAHSFNLNVVTADAALLESHGILRLRGFADRPETGLLALMKTTYERYEQHFNAYNPTNSMPDKVSKKQDRGESGFYPNMRPNNGLFWMYKDRIVNGLPVQEFNWDQDQRYSNAHGTIGERVQAALDPSLFDKAAHRLTQTTQDIKHTLSLDM